MDYTYINGQLKVIEENILDSDDFLKLAKAPKDIFLKTLIDLGYGNLAESVEEVIQNELTSVKEFYDTVTPNKELTDLFFLVNDLVNIKYFYKIKVFGLKDIDNFQENGVFTKDELVSVILDNDYSKIVKEYHKFFKKIEKNIQGVNNPRILSAKIDATFFEFILDNLKVKMNAPLSTYYKTLIDIKNIITYVRVKNLNWKFIDNKELFIKGGSINLEVIKTLFDLKEDEVVRKLNTYYDEKISAILKDYFSDKDLTKLEIKLNNLLLNRMKVFEDDAFGIGIMLYYYLKKLAEADNIRYTYANTNFDVSNLLVY